MSATEERMIGKQHHAETVQRPRFELQAFGDVGARQACRLVGLGVALLRERERRGVLVEQRPGTAHAPESEQRQAYFVG
jgi:hypothetical protein